MKEFICKRCGKHFNSSPSSNRKFCSRICFYATRKGEKHPYLAGSNNPNWVGGLPNCVDCGKKLSNYHYKRCKKCNNTGERSPAWKGGVTPEIRKLRMSAEYRAWRDLVFKRDNYTCVWCGIKNEDGLGKTIRLNADHIKRFSEYPELRFIVSNGRTLCEDCHRETGTFGRLRRVGGYELQRLY